MNKSVALLALVSFLAVPVGASLAGTTTTTPTSSAHSSSPSSSPAPAARTATTSFGQFGNAPKQVAAPTAPAPRAETPAPAKPAPVAAVPVPKPEPATTPVSTQKSLAFGATGSAPLGKSADSAPVKSASAMSADLTKSAQQSRALTDWDNRNRAPTAPSSTELRRDHVLPSDTAPRRIDTPSPQTASAATVAEQERRMMAERERMIAKRERQVARDERRQDYYYRDRPVVVQQPSNNDFVNGVIVGSALNHGNDRPTVVIQQPAAPYQPAQPASDDRQLQRYEAPQPSHGESSGSGSYWFFVILVSLAIAGVAYWFLNRKPTVPVGATPKPSKKSHYDLG